MLCIMPENQLLHMLQSHRNSCCFFFKIFCFRISRCISINYVNKLHCLDCFSSLFLEMPQSIHSLHWITHRRKYRLVLDCYKQTGAQSLYISLCGWDEDQRTESRVPLLMLLHSFFNVQRLPWDLNVTERCLYIICSFFSALKLCWMWMVNVTGRFWFYCTSDSSLQLVFTLSAAWITFSQASNSPSEAKTCYIYVTYFTQLHNLWVYNAKTKAHLWINCAIKSKKVGFMVFSSPISAGSTVFTLYITLLLTKIIYGDMH